MSSNQKWDASLYDGKHSFVANYGNDLVELLNPKSGEKILDLGCGTGDLTQKIAESGAEVVGIDASEAMVLRAQQKYSSISFSVMDATALAFETAFDAVFSNAVLHWVLEKERVLESIYQVLKPGGRMVVEFGGKDNCSQINQRIIENIEARGYTYQFPWYFPSIGEYAQLLERVGFEVSYAIHYDRFTKLEGEEGMRNWIAMFSSNFFKTVEANDQQVIINKTIEQLRDSLYVDKSWYVDYKRIRVVAIKR
ncbi:methyltransferase domain-containing protein [Fusibacter paucivorans]|uniref:Methyltransferase domain-containing protein n=1 Tax=Fusibacter paucivorans TaxID=76009 RepID=A0ABS5PNY3_9FIRM|nr:class I SAM-dependent methyltransferase [Fusibacter paucivorans]MBS7526084.1 methyltransferase domain-containing protein [Fusibacter paucivorans]